MSTTDSAGNTNPFPASAQSQIGSLLPRHRAARLCTLQIKSTAHTPDSVAAGQSIASANSYPTGEGLTRWRKGEMRHRRTTLAVIGTLLALAGYAALPAAAAPPTNRYA